MPNIAVFIEQRDGAVKKVAWQMISEARRLTAAAGGEVWGVFLGAGADASPLPHHHMGSQGGASLHHRAAPQPGHPGGSLGIPDQAGAAGVAPA